MSPAARFAREGEQERQSEIAWRYPPVRLEGRSASVAVFERLAIRIFPSFETKTCCGNAGTQRTSKENLAIRYPVAKKNAADADAAAA